MARSLPIVAMWAAVAVTAAFAPNVVVPIAMFAAIATLFVS